VFEAVLALDEVRGRTQSLAVLVDGTACATVPHGVGLLRRDWPNSWLSRKRPPSRACCAIGPWHRTGMLGSDIKRGGLQDASPDGDIYRLVSTAIRGPSSPMCGHRHFVFTCSLDL